MHHQVVGFQITAADQKKIKDFYADAFGWTFTPGPHENVSDTTAGGGIPGDIIGRGDFIPDYVSLYISTNDIPATIEQCVKAGGEIIRPQFELDNGRRLAIVADPEGHVLTLVDTSNEK